MHREFVEVDIDEVTLKESIREDVGDIGMLTTSVSKLGLLTPILVDRNNIVITGARRLAACRAAGIRQLPAIRLDTDYDSMTALDIQVDMNLCRQPLTGKEVETLIGKKRIAASRQGGGASGGVLSRIKQLFGND
ncbi:MAG: ParB N-terminal domain-containing protein [Kiritimatiellae bacterium]|nr:ParB N-terminal domain-containing protein [Kiritimatiellia bacterium]